jgi:hypothetical protein
MKDILRTNWIKQGQKSLLRIVSFFREESLPQIVSGTYDPNAILKNLSDQDICSDSKELIDRERNAVDLYDQRDSKGHILFTSFMIWNILDKIFVPIHVQSNSLSSIQQFQQYAIVFQNVLASNQFSAVEEAMYNSLIGHEDFLWTEKQHAICGGMMEKSSRQPYAQQGLGLIRSWPLRSALEGAPMDVIHHSEIGIIIYFATPPAGSPTVAHAMKAPSPPLP